MIGMGPKLAALKRAYYRYLDKKARHLAHRTSERKPVGRLLDRSVVSSPSEPEFNSHPALEKDKGSNVGTDLT
jgi:hypothetical protein